MRNRTRVLWKVRAWGNDGDAFWMLLDDAYQSTALHARSFRIRRCGTERRGRPNRKRRYDDRYALLSRKRNGQKCFTPCSLKSGFSLQSTSSAPDVGFKVVENLFQQDIQFSNEFSRDNAEVITVVWSCRPHQTAPSGEIVHELAVKQRMIRGNVQNRKGMQLRSCDIMVEKNETMDGYARTILLKSSTRCSPNRTTQKRKLESAPTNEIHN